MALVVHPPSHPLMEGAGSRSGVSSSGTDPGDTTRVLPSVSGEGLWSGRGERGCVASAAVLTEKFWILEKANLRFIQGKINRQLRQVRSPYKSRALLLRRGWSVAPTNSQEHVYPLCYLCLSPNLLEFMSIAEGDKYFCLQICMCICICLGVCRCG